MQSQKFKDINQASEIVSLSQSTIIAWEAEGKFPKAVRLSKKKRVWLESDLNEWVLKMHASETQNFGE